MISRDRGEGEAAKEMGRRVERDGVKMQMDFKSRVKQGNGRRDSSDAIYKVRERERERAGRTHGSRDRRFGGWYRLWFDLQHGLTYEGKRGNLVSERRGKKRRRRDELGSHDSIRLRPGERVDVGGGKRATH